MIAAPRAISASFRKGSVPRLIAACLVTLTVAGCHSRSPETTGSIGAQPVSPRQADALAESYAANPNDLSVAMRYAQALRATGQHAQASAVLQQAALRNPRNTAVLGAYGKSLVEVGRLQEAQDVLQNAHSPAQPDWRILSAQGSVSDQLGDHARAQGFYDAALKIRPNEPSVLSNLGLSYALGRQLDRAEETMRTAVAQPGADARVRGNLALVLGLKGRFDEAEAILRRDLPPMEVAANIASLRSLAAKSSRSTAPTAARKPTAERG